MSTLVYASITTKVNHLIEKLHIIKDSLSDPQVADSKLKFFNKAVSFLHISGQRNHLGRELRGRDKASQQEPSALIKKFLAEIGYSFVDDLLSEIKEALVVDNPILEAFNIFSMETQSEDYRREQMHILCNHYGDKINDVYQGDSTPAEAIISTLEQEVEFQDFFCTFHEVVKELNDQAKKQAQQKVLKGEIKQKDIPEYLNTIKPTLSDLYSKMCSEGSVHNFPNNMKLLKLALLIPPLTSGVERGFSVMNLLVSPLLKSLSENNVDRLMRICLDGPKFLIEEQLEKIIDIYKDNAPRRISL